MRATFEPAQNTVPLPAFTAAVCGAQAGDGGKGCATVGSPTLATSLPLANTVLCPGVASVEVVAQM
jgi:hypothetical protein